VAEHVMVGIRRGTRVTGIARVARRARGSAGAAAGVAAGVAASVARGAARVGFVAAAKREGVAGYHQGRGPSRQHQHQHPHGLRHDALLDRKPLMAPPIMVEATRLHSATRGSHNAPFPPYPLRRVNQKNRTRLSSLTKKKIRPTSGTRKELVEMLALGPVPA
jgi:hypothetical protein